MPSVSSRIAIIQGHPDGVNEHYCHALAAAYADGAVSAGHEVRPINVTGLSFQLLRSQKEWTAGSCLSTSRPRRKR